MALNELNDDSAAGREALLESLALSSGGKSVRLVVILVTALPAVALLDAPQLLIWLAALLTWDGVIVGLLKRHWVLPALDHSLREARLRRAAMVLFGLSLAQVLPLTAWAAGGAFGTAVAAVWVLCSATQVFVYYSHDRLSLIGGMIPVLLCALIGPALSAGLNWEGAAITLFMLFGIGAGAAFVGRSDALIAQAADEAAGRRAAETANSAKSRFIANMHHELRTPLNAVIGYSEMLRESAADAGRDADVADLDRILAAAHTQLMMITDLLAFSELQDNRLALELHDFDAGALARETAAAMRGAVEANGNTLAVHTGANLQGVRSDPAKLRHCLEHLLSNAGKFTRDGAVVLRVRRELSAGADWVVFTVEDTGVGIAPERQRVIFEPFTQADDTATRGADGAGLGLAIAARISRLLGGGVSVDSAPGKGAAFALRVRADLGAGDRTGQWSPPTARLQAS